MYLTFVTRSKSFSCSDSRSDTSMKRTYFASPPYTTHKMQPMDGAFMSRFKGYYSQEIETWMCNHSFRKLTAYLLGELIRNDHSEVWYSSNSNSSSSQSTFSNETEILLSAQMTKSALMKNVFSSMNHLRRIHLGNSESIILVIFTGAERKTWKRYLSDNCC